MIYEIRTYRIAPGSLAEVERIFGEAYEHRKKYSELAAFWHTEIGPLNEIIHLWKYEDLADRARVRAAAAKDPNWPPKLAPFIREQRAELITPFAFLPEIKPGKVGPYFELRYYTITPGVLPDMRKRWEESLPARTKLSPILLAGNIEFGRANGFIHIWPYQSLDQRAQVRAEAMRTGVWPPPGGGGQLMSQKNKIMLPAKFSPLQ